MMESNHLNLDTESRLISDPRKMDKSLLPPNLTNVCSSDHIMKSRSEMMPLTNHNDRDYSCSHKKYSHRSPSSPRKCSKLRTSCSARDLNIHSSSPNVDTTCPGNGAVGGKLQDRGQSIICSLSSFQESRRKERKRREKKEMKEALKVFSSISGALEGQTSDQYHESTSQEKGKSQSFSVSCQ
jgi:hypothetical protein